MHNLTKVRHWCFWVTLRGLAPKTTRRGRRQCIYLLLTATSKVPMLGTIYNMAVLMNTE